MSKHDTASNTAQAARAKRAAGNPYDQAGGGTEKKKATLEQAGEAERTPPGGKGRARAVDVTQAFTVTSAAGGGEAVRRPAGHTGVL